MNKYEKRISLPKTKITVFPYGSRNFLLSLELTLESSILIVRNQSPYFVSSRVFIKYYSRVWSHAYPPM
jgi:hypothetical protein